ncbi:hypothetical protein F9K50_07445, partial [bacterium]
MTLMLGALPFRAPWAQDIFSAKSYRVKGSGETAAPKPEPAKNPMPPGVQLPEGTQVFVPSVPEYVYHEVANPQPVAVPKGPPPVYVNHEVFGKILEKFVSKSGWVNYRDLKRDKEALESLDAYVNDLM